MKKGVKNTTHPNISMRIKSIELHNFKSFKRAKITLPANFICFIGPNGSGKSNVCDAVRFALGENSLKALRVHNTTQLIHTNGKKARVTLTLQLNDTERVISREIDANGKVRYFLDNKRVKRSTLKDFLRQHNVDDSGRHVIGQGEIERFLALNAKERRQIIEKVSGIATFEEKKKEAERELAEVEQRIREVSLLLGEKLDTLQRLEKEKAEAERFLHYKKLLTDSKGTLIKTWLAQLTDKRQQLQQRATQYSQQLQQLNNTLTTLNTQIKDVEDAMAQLTSLEERTQLMKKKELEQQLSVELVKCEQTLNFLKQRLEENNAQLQHTNTTLQTLLKDKLQCERELKTLSPLTTTTAQNTHSQQLKQRLSHLHNQRQQLEKTVNELEAEIRVLSQQRSPDVQPTDITTLRKEKDSINNELRALFEQEKRLNAQLTEVERQSINVRERLSELRAKHPKAFFNKLFDFITHLKTKVHGLYGPLIDLINFDMRFAKAVESAGGLRLSYIVVEDTDVAIEVIKHLKHSKVGRASFIPLKNVKFREVHTNYPTLLHVLSYDPRVENAVKYVFGDTLLVNDVEEAKRIGVGKYRMVTLDGELFETSGIVSGGYATTSLTVSSLINNLTKELEQLKQRREELMNALRSVRGKMTLLRDKKISVEMKLKEQELLLKEQEKQRELERTINTKKQQLQHAYAQLKGVKDVIRRLEQQLAQVLEEERKKQEKTLLERGKIEERITHLQQRLTELKKQIEQQQQTHKQLVQQSQELHKQVQALTQQHNKLSHQLTHVRKELEQLQRTLETNNKNHAKLNEKLVALSRERARVQQSLNATKNALANVDKELSVLDVRIADLERELAELGTFTTLNLSQEQLKHNIEQAQQFLSQHQYVNLAAIELYEEKKAEVGEVKDKLDTLKAERERVLDLIANIEKRKEETFLKAFNEVRAAFERLFKDTGVEGEATLTLDNPTDVFNAGLHITVKRGEKSIDLLSLSGGEKALLSLAFLFALDAGNPSPIYILDEIDASLDADNSKRIGQFIKTLSKRKQFLVVTHREQMVLNADVVFGITKRQGESKVFGLKLSQHT